MSASANMYTVMISGHVHIHIQSCIFKLCVGIKIIWSRIINVWHILHDYLCNSLLWQRWRPFKILLYLLLWELMTNVALTGSHKVLKLDSTYVSIIFLITA